MPQETMNIALPETMKVFVLEQISQGGYSTASEYVRDLIRADQKLKAAQRLDALLLDGLDGGGNASLTKKQWNELRAQVQARLKKSPRT